MNANKEIILGINWEQNSTAALMINGEIVSCVSEERFSRVKNDERYPKKAIDWILYENNIKKKDITQVCSASKAWAPSYSLVRQYTKFSIKDHIKEQNEILCGNFNFNKKFFLLLQNSFIFL